MKHILLTNDDGYQAIGFYPLLRELSKNFKVTAVAPDRKRSWQGKSITCYHELEVKKVKLEEFEIYITSGTPADCVQLGLHNLDLGKIDFVVSGINIGLNAGHGRLFSSGTAGAAIESAIYGTKALASSLHLSHDHDKEINYFDPKFYHVYDQPAKITAKIVEKVLAHDLTDDIDVISVNIPFGADSNTEMKITSLARDKYGKLFEKIGE
jgi:5'-nucleotidase